MEHGMTLERSHPANGSVCTTWLTQAPRDVSGEYVHLLLRRGEDINACDCRGRRSIDYSFDGNHHKVTLLLLRSDSLLPHRSGREQEDRWKAVINLDSGIKHFLMNRDEFHQMLLDDKPDSLEKIRKFVENSEHAGIVPRYWVNSDGKSALYVAGSRDKHRVWAQLKVLCFEYAPGEESRMKNKETGKPFRDAIREHCRTPTGLHVQNMRAKIMILNISGVDEESCGNKINDLFEGIRGDTFLSLLTECLENDQYLQIIFDFSRTDIKNIHPLNSVLHFYGLTDLENNIIYLAAKETKEFRYSDVISNLVHELAHKVLVVVFENGGLPFRKEDVDVKEEYENVVRKVLSDENIKMCDRIIQRVVGYPQMRAHELIVRVPEMIAKHKDYGDGRDCAADGFSRLRKQAPELLEFYVKRVIPKMREYIEEDKRPSSSQRMAQQPKRFKCSLRGMTQRSKDMAAEVYDEGIQKLVTRLKTNV